MLRNWRKTGGKTPLVLFIVLVGAISLLMAQPTLLQNNFAVSATSFLSGILNLDPISLSAPLADTSAPSFGNVRLMANPSANLDQCANDPLPSSHLDGCNSSATQWVNGNLGASKSVYFEGDSISYRMRFDNLPQSQHTVTIEWDTTKSSKHAIDYLTTFNQSVLDANPCLGVTGCTFPGTQNVDYSTFTIPPDPQVTNAGVTPIAGNFILYGGTINSVGPAGNEYSGGSNFSTGDNSRRITITFTPNRANPVLAWGGHISTRKDWGNDGSAVAIPGSPYHTRLIDLDGSGGNQDRSLSAAAVIFPGSITIIKNANPQGSTGFPFTASPTPLANFSLVDDGTSANTKSFSNIINFQTYTVTENTPSGWSFDGASCSVTSANGGTQTVSGSTATINLAEGENVTCTYRNTQQNPALSIVKTATETGYNAVGQVIHYSIVATNVGNVTLSSVTVTDPNASNLTCTPANGSSLAPSASMSCTASHTITQADLDAGHYYNQACVDDGAGGAAQQCSDVDTPGTAPPHLSITKVATESSFSKVGDIIHYTIVATNDGNLTLHNVTVTDAQVTDLSCTPSTPVANLAPGASISCTATHTIVQADLDAGSFYNQACVDDGTGPAAQACADVTTPGVQTQQLTITKVATEAGYDAVGQVIHYTIVATNSGNVTLHNVTVTDTQVSNLSCTPSNPVADLAPQATITCTASHTIVQADLDAGSFYNQACADDGAGGADQKCADVTTPGTKRPHLSLTKTAAETIYSAVGQVIHYTIVATNDGNVTLGSVTVTDPSADGLTCSPANGSSLAPGASMTCTATHTITQADIDAGHFDNAACVDDGPGGAPQACGDVDTPGSSNPDVKVEKSGNGTINSGDTAIFTITVTSIGNATALNVSLTDTLPSGLTWSLGGANAGDCTLSGTSLSCNFGNMAPGASKTITVSATTSAANCGPMTNTATVSALRDVDSTNNSSQATITVQCLNPSGSYPTNTTCQDFIGNTVVPQENGQYSVKGNSINQANPGVIFFYAQFSAIDSIAFVNQAIEKPPTASTFNTTMQVQSAAVFTATCGSTNVSVTAAPTADQTFNTEWGPQTDVNALKLSNLTDGQNYVLQVKYSVSSLAGSPPPKVGSTFTDIVYQFQLWDPTKSFLLAKDANGFTLTKK